MYKRQILDHQPKDLKTSAKSNIDLHLSGHTHAGQIFPAYYIFELFNINELNYGKEKIDNMIAINSSGIEMCIRDRFQCLLIIMVFLEFYQK